MKISLPLSAALLALAVCIAHAAPAGSPELHGMIATGQAQKFLLSSPSGTNSQWVSVGDSYGAWRVQEYRPKDSLLVLKSGDGNELDLSLVATSIKAAEAKATLDDAKRLFERMRFKDTFAKLLANQKAIGASQILQGLMRVKGNATPEEIAAEQKLMVDAMWSGVDMAALQETAEKIYSQEFTPEELDAIGDFHETPAIQAQMGQAFLQQAQAAMPQLIQMQKQFAAAHRPAPPVR